MVELVKPQQKIRDLTNPSRRIPIEVDGASSYEVILTIWHAFSPQEEVENLDVGMDWLGDIVSTTPDDLAAELRAIGGPHCSIWLSVLGLISVAPHPHDPASVFNWMAQLNPDRLRRWILGYIGQQEADSNLTVTPSASVVEEAASGDHDALLTVLGEKADPEQRDRFIELFAIEATEFRDRLVTAIRRFRNEVFAPHEEEFGEAISRAATARRAMATRDSAKDVIEQVTNGLDYEIPLGVTRVVLVPSVILRPLSMIDRHREMLLVFYGLDDDFLINNPEAPPAWMVKFYKAMSDEKRLRILRRLSEGDTSLDELTTMLDISKSTVHHHITILRAAGLIRIQIRNNDGGKESKCYGLRPQAFEDASSSLESYMRPIAESALA
jgi:DNA-binding transcriptional ArsR family regulator